ncbi:MAG: hypothetical protein CG442_1075 [Methylococcaceae bacterium NSO1]|nr:MAG: hypothetical protein CG442_1075 [Methylococcaceae bacterium NSO1]
MKRRHTSNDFYLINRAELGRKTAIHEAGPMPSSAGKPLFMKLDMRLRFISAISKNICHRFFFRFLLKNSIATFNQLDVYANLMIVVIIVLLK